MNQQFHNNHIAISYNSVLHKQSSLQDLILLHTNQFNYLSARTNFLACFQSNTQIKVKQLRTRETNCTICVFIYLNAFSTILSHPTEINLSSKPYQVHMISHEQSSIEASRKENARVPYLVFVRVFIIKLGANVGTFR